MDNEFKTPDILYHLTDEKHLMKILKEGLIPQTGSNCDRVGDDCCAVFLCGEEDIGRWSILLGKTVLLRVHSSELPTMLFQYSSCSEYICEAAIGPENIELVSMACSHTDEDMYVLCKSYLYSLSNLALMCAKYYNNIGSITAENVNHLSRLTLTALEKLDYSVADQSEWRRIVKEDGESGEYTFCDTYNNTDTRLWEQLILYPQDESYEYRQKIHDFVDKTFPFAREINTGGWFV